MQSIILNSGRSSLFRKRPTKGVLPSHPPSPRLIERPVIGILDVSVESLDGVSSRCVHRVPLGATVVKVLSVFRTGCRWEGDRGPVGADLFGVSGYDKDTGATSYIAHWIAQRTREGGRSSNGRTAHWDVTIRVRTLFWTN
jgi:hypothetical protein